MLGPVSNGEFLLLAATPVDVRLARAVLDRAATAAQALGMDRRMSLQTAGGMAALLTTISSGSVGQDLLEEVAGVALLDVGDLLR